MTQTTNKKRSTVGTLVKLDKYDKLKGVGGVVDKKSLKSCFINLTTYFKNKKGNPLENLKKFKYFLKKTIEKSIKDDGNLEDKYILDFTYPSTYMTTNYAVVSIELNFFFVDITKIDLTKTIKGITNQINDYLNSIDYIEIYLK